MARRAGAQVPRGEELHPHSAPRGLLEVYSLLSIAKRPMRGYDLIKEIEMKTDGAWRPGPGAVYPLLRKLAKRGDLSARESDEFRPSQVVYGITSQGLRRISVAKKVMRSYPARWKMMSSLFLELLEPDDLVKFVLSLFEFQTEILRTILDSDRTGLSQEDKVFALRQYRLNLERELARTDASIKVHSGRLGQEGAPVGTARKRGRA
jgi:DNA-binding PadR family transcriptional regulator